MDADALSDPRVLQPGLAAVAPCTHAASPSRPFAREKHCRDLPGPWMCSTTVCLVSVEIHTPLKSPPITFSPALVPTPASPAKVLKAQKQIKQHP